MKTKPGRTGRRVIERRVISLFLAVIMCLSLLPGTSSFTAFAGGAFLEAIYFDNNRSNGYGSVTDGYLEKDSGGAVHFDVSGGKSMSENCTISSVWLVDADSRAEKYNLLSSAYGGTNECKVYSPFTVSETGETIYPLEIWIHGLTIPNAAAGDYRLRVVTSTGTFYSDEYSDPYISTDGIVHIVEMGEAPAVQSSFKITTDYLPRGRVGEEYSAWLTASHTVTSWEVAEGSLPAGLTLDEGSGELSGTPQKSGSFSFTIRAEDFQGNTAETEFNLKITMKQLSGYWTASLTPWIPCSGMTTDYEFLIRPSMDMVPTKASSLTVTLPGNVLTEDSTLDNDDISPGGITGRVEKENGTITFSFNGETEITAEDGIAFTLKDVTNPDNYSVSAYVRSDNWESSTAAYRMDQTSASASLVGKNGMLVTISDWESLKYMPAKRLSVTWGEEGSSTHYCYDESSLFTGINIAVDESYTVTLEVRDSFDKWHKYAVVTGTGDGKGNLVRINPSPGESERIRPYRLKKTLGTQEIANEELEYRLYSYLCKNGCSLSYSYYNVDGTYGNTYWFTNDDVEQGGFTAYTSNNFASDPDLKAYDRDGCDITIDKNEGQNEGLITLDYPLLSRNASFSGTVMDSGNTGIPYASLLSSQTVNGVTNTVNIVADEYGAYTVPDLYAGKEVNLTVWADGYEEENRSNIIPVQNDTPGVNVSLNAVGRVTVLIGDGKSVSNPSFAVYGGGRGESYSFAGGTSFGLDLPFEWETSDNTEYTVSMYTDDSEGTTSGKAVFSGGTAFVTLNPARLGTLDWSALEGTGYYVLITLDGSIQKACPIAERQCRLPAGTYTVYLSSKRDSYSGCPDESKGTFVVAAGDTTEVSGLTPPSVAMDVVGGVTGPATAPRGGLYKLSAILESEINGSDNSAFTGFTISLSDNSTLQGMTVNGSYVGLSSGAGYWVTIDKDNYNAVDWTFPLECTLYLRQNAATGSSQNVELIADYNSVNYGSRSVSLGSVSTRSVPSLTLYAPARIGARLVDADINGVTSKSWQPEAFAFSGTGVKNQDVRIYDNEQLIAIVRADEKGSFSGMAYPASTYSDHLIRAEQQSGGDTLSVTKELLYEPSGPVLTGLSLITNGYRRWQLPINGAPAAYTATPTMVYQYEAEIRNEEQLDEITVQNPAAESSDDQETLTAKVFFRVFSAGGETLLPAEKEGAVWKSEERHFGGNYPTGVEVLYRPKESTHEASVLIQDESIPAEDKTVTVDYNYVLYNSDGSTVEAASQTELYELMGLNPEDDGSNVAPDWDLGYPEWNEDNPASNGWALPPAPSSDELEAEQATESFESLETGGSGSANVVLLSEGVESSVTDGFEEEEARLLSDSKSLSDLFTNIANSVNQGLGVGNELNDLVDENGRVTEISTLNGQQAVSNGANNLTMEVRTWIDQPTWTSSGVKWRVEELRGKGYKAMSASYDDNQYLYFTGNYYYDKYGRPSSLTRTVHAMGGVDQTEPNPDMYSRTMGQMIGSSLKVEYIYSVKEGKWMRSQTAMIPPGASSPIHLAANQIPDATTPPYRYTPASQLSEDFDDSDMEAGALMAEDSPFTEEESRVYAVLAEGATNRTGGMSWGVKLDKVQNSTYAGMAISGTGYLGAKWVGASKKLHKLTLGDKDKMVKIGKKFEIAQGEYSLSMEESIVTGVAWGEGWIPQGQETKFGNIGGIREQLLANYKYYSNLEDNPAYSYRASRGKQDTKKLLEALGDVEYAIEMAGVQDAFTNNVTTQLSFASGFIGLFGGPIGAEASFAIDLYSTFLKAANDTNNAEVKAAVERFLSQVDSYKASDAESKKKMKEAEQANKDYNNEMGFPIYDIDEDVFNDPFDPNYKPPQTAQTTPVHDPSGIIYEAVIENPVQGASVTLWRYDEEAEDMERHDDSAYLGQQNPLASDESGYYHWDVPEGKWYVTAEKAGYSAGSSQEDRAATKSFNITGRGSVNFLPVLPPQLDVNIPLTDPSAPVVEEVEFSDEGIYVTFSKYMADTVGGEVDAAESVLNEDNYTLLEWGGAPFTAFTVEAVEQGHTPANRDGGVTGTYTRKILLRPGSGTGLAGHRITLIVAGTLSSYAGTAIGSDFVRTGTIGGIEMDDIVPSGLMVSVLVSCEVNDATALCSVFRENGQMVGVYSIPLDKGDRQKLEFTIRQSNYSYVQIQVLDSELVPLYTSRRIRAGG